MPRIASALERIATALEKQNEERTVAEKPKEDDKELLED